MYKGEPSIHQDPLPRGAQGPVSFLQLESDLARIGTCGSTPHLGSLFVRDEGPHFRGNISYSVGN